MGNSNREKELIAELSAKYPIYLYENIVKPEHLTQNELSKYADLYAKEHKNEDIHAIRAGILGYADKAKEDGLIFLPPKGNLQPNGLYFEKGNLVIPGLAATRDHEIVSYSHDVQKAYNDIRHLEPIITKDILRAVDHAGAECRGLENAVKTGTSMADKIERDMEHKGISALQAVNALSDIVRYTAVADEKNLFLIARNVLEDLKGSKYQPIKIKNFFEMPKESGYRGLHFAFLSPVRQKIELQFHTERSFT